MHGDRNDVRLVDLRIRRPRPTARAVPFFEELPALPLEDGLHKLLSSPGLALNPAKGDIMRVPEGAFPAEVITRGGNFCIQIFADSLDHDRIYALEQHVAQDLSGSLDGIHDGTLSLSVPATHGFPRIAKRFDEFSTATGCQWHYANI